MKIAVCGAHAVGETTLVTALRRLLVDDGLGVSGKVLAGHGSVAERMNQVLEKLPR